MQEPQVVGRKGKAEGNACLHNLSSLRLLSVQSGLSVSFIRSPPKLLYVKVAWRAALTRLRMSLSDVVNRSLYQIMEEMEDSTCLTLRVGKKVRITFALSWLVRR